MGFLDVLGRFRLDGDAAFVTGAGNGIGRVAALALAEAGAAVAVTDIDPAAAQAVAAEITAAGGRAAPFALDIGDEAAIIATVAAAAARFGRLDVLVNNAAIVKRQPTEDFATDDWRRIIDVNVTGAFIASREVGRLMLAAGGGRIINVSSIMGLVGNGLYPNLAYNTSKTALVGITRSLAAEWASRGIRVNAIAPAFVKTRLTEKLRADTETAAAIEARTPMGRFVEPDELAAGILYLASRASSMVTGHVLAIDGGWLAI